MPSFLSLFCENIIVPVLKFTKSNLQLFAKDVNIDGRRCVFHIEVQSFLPVNGEEIEP